MPSDKNNYLNDLFIINNLLLAFNFNYSNLEKSHFFLNYHPLTLNQHQFIRLIEGLEYRECDYERLIKFWEYIFSHVLLVIKLLTLVTKWFLIDLMKPKMKALRTWTWITGRGIVRTGVLTNYTMPSIWLITWSKLFYTTPFQLYSVYFLWELLFIWFTNVEIKVNCTS